jgi:branched-chain amino acid transport system ATP-binding protein
MALLNIEGLVVRYGAIEAVRGVTLGVEAGEIVVLLGANGAGKSSVMKACMGLVPAAGGSVVLDGADITALPTAAIVRRRMTLTPEGRRIFARLTVDENLDIGAGADGGLIARLPANKERMFEMFPILAERRGQMAGSLSGGEQQMLAIARSLVSEPKLLLLDEPSLGLAPIVVDQVFDLIARLRADGITILLVEQNAERALEVADRGYVLASGAIAMAGPAAELREGEALSRAYLGLAEG